LCPFRGKRQLRKIIIANKVYVPIELVDEETVKEHYVHDIYVEKTCQKCPVIKKGLSRPNVVDTGKIIFSCHECPWNAYTGHYESYKIVQIKGHKYYAIPKGDLPSVKRNLNISLKDALDIRCNRKTKTPITFATKLYTGKELRNGKPTPNQRAVVRSFIKSKGSTGVIKCPPRAGKTAMAVYVSCKSRMYTLFLVHEKILLRQFYKTFLDFTDIKQAEKRAGKKLVLIARTEKDLLADVPYLMVNYQKFISELGLKRVAKHLNKKYGIVVVDEIHRSSSDKYNDLLNRLDTKHIIGLTATDNRKDGKYILTQETLGQVVAESFVEALTPVIYVKKTNYQPKRQWRGMQAYNKSVQFLGGLKERNIDIVKQVFADLREHPKNSIVIPVKHIKHAKLLTSWINKQAAYNVTYKGEKWPDKVAEMLSGALKEDDKEDLLNRARNYKTRVVIAIEKFVKDGIDVGAWTHMYTVFPGSNHENTYQTTKRICTVYEGKRRPVLRVWLDPITIMENCVKSTYTNSYKLLKYKIGRKSKEILDELENSKAVGKTRISTKTDLHQFWGGGGLKDTPKVTSIRTR